jgi:hypothetical protein
MGSKEVPSNARGRTADSPFWGLNDTDQARFNQGWWCAYHHKPLSRGTHAAFRMGWVEGHQMLYDMGTRGPGRYRYTLARNIGGEKGIVLFCMLNPSTADDTADDPTIRRCKGFAKLWGYTQLRVVNLFAIRSTDPKALRDMDDPVGNGTNEIIADELKKADLLVLAWGATGGFVYQKMLFLDRFGKHPWKCLGVTKAGHPKHPLYIPYKVELVDYPTKAFMDKESV